jgi:hypothetical protein
MFGTQEKIDAQLKNKKETPGSLIVVKGTEDGKKMVCTLLIHRYPRKSIT